MLRTNELRLMPDMPIEIAMVPMATELAQVAACPVQPRCKHAALPCCLTGSSRIHSMAQIPRTSVPIQRHRHLDERRWRLSTRKPSVSIATVMPRKSLDASKVHRPVVALLWRIQHKQAKNLRSLREEFSAESSETSSARTFRAEGDDDRLAIKRTNVDYIVKD